MARAKNRFIVSSLLTTPTLLIAKIFLFGVARAQQMSTPPSIVTNASELGPNLFCPILKYMFMVIIIISVFAALWAAYTYITAGDDTEKTTKARKILLYAAVGVVVALVAFGFPSVIASIFPNAGGSFSSCSGS